MSAVVLDISRTVSRVSRGPATGIDRVELAYIEHFLEWPEQVGFLARFGKRTVLLDRAGMRKFYALLQNDGPWNNLGILGVLRKKKHHANAKIEATARRLSLSWPFLAKGLRQHMPDGFTYLNVGHGAMRADFWPRLRDSNVGKIGILIHDVIPLDYPEYSAKIVRERYASDMQAAANAADFLIFNSTDTKVRTEFWLKEWGQDNLESHVALLGTNPLPYDTAKKIDEHPYFVTLGTIEPRKNHKLLLDIWDGFQKTLPPKDIPHLYIIGGRGWLNNDVFHTLDTADFMGKTVYEMGKISDAELGPLLANAHALLFPSFAEGFGYPLIEAMQMNTPVICSDLECFEEISEKFPTYINPRNQDAWRAEILAVATQGRKSVENSKKLPSWPEHFHKINTIIGNNS